MATYRISISRRVEFTETAEVDVELPCPPHPSDKDVRAAVAGFDLDWVESSYNFGDTKIEKIEGIADDDDAIIETGFD